MALRGRCHVPEVAYLSQPRALEHRSGVPGVDRVAEPQAGNREATAPASSCSAPLFDPIERRGADASPPVLGVHYTQGLYALGFFAHRLPVGDDREVEVQVAHADRTKSAPSTTWPASSRSSAITGRPLHRGRLGSAPVARIRQDILVGRLDPSPPRPNGTRALPWSQETVGLGRGAGRGGRHA
jgi:hypothetical protein